MSDDTIKVGDRVTWVHYWTQIKQEEVMIGTVAYLVNPAFGTSAWINVEGDPVPMFATISQLTRLDAAETEPSP